MKHMLKGHGKTWLFVVVIILATICGFLSMNVNINYDMTAYLPKDSNTLQGINILEQEFGSKTTIQVMIDGEDINEVLHIKSLIQGVDRVLQVLWLDDVVDVSVDLSIYDPVIVAPFYHNDKSLLTISFEGDEYNLGMEESVEDIRQLLSDYSISIRGNALNSIESRKIAQGEILKIMLFIIPLCILLLLIASKSWFEPVILLMVLGIGIVFNMGTNVFLPNVSFITMTMAMALQLALSMDYSLFMIHRFYEELDKGYEVHIAATSALKKALPSISASAATTIVGFLALLFMRYTIGFDIGIVLSKGIVFSYLSVVLVMPILLVWFAPLLIKTKHKTLIPSIGKFTNTYHRLRWVFSFGLVIIAALAYLFSTQTSYLYGAGQATIEDSQIQMESNQIMESFGEYQPIVLLIPNDEIEKEISIVTELMGLEHVMKVEALVSVANPMIPREFLPVELVRNFVGEEYSRMIIYINLSTETDEMYDLVDQMNQVVNEHYPNYYFVGMATSIQDIKLTVTEDTIIVTIVSISAVLIVIMLIFRSLIVPFLLIAVIQTSIWINVSVSYFQDVQVMYIGYLIVMALQLGATIDYAVLLSNRYLEFRKTMNKKEAMKEAMNKSTHPIIISALILAIAGFTEGLFSNIKAVQEIGILIGRGALISGIMVLMFLPGLLLLFDKIILKTTLSGRLFKQRKKSTIDLD